MDPRRPTTQADDAAARSRPFRIVDVFGTGPFSGNPLAVVHDSEGLDTEAMQRFARWMNLSETTFFVTPTDPAADYSVRIFTPVSELPFAGHPTLGSCHAWLSAGGHPQSPDRIVQECPAGLVAVRPSSGGFAFAAPPLVRSGPVEEALIDRIATVLGIDRSEIVDAQWVDNGPGWVAALLPTAGAVLALRPGLIDFDLGVVGPYPAGSEAAWEVRAFFPKDGSTVEDPVTGSLNASLAEWLVRSERATLPYVASQGTALGRSGRVRLFTGDDGGIWVGGNATTQITGEVVL
jgi:PhzF family phenazine biosynthesis protein